MKIKITYNLKGMFGKLYSIGTVMAMISKRNIYNTSEKH